MRLWVMAAWLVAVVVRPGAAQAVLDAKAVPGLGAAGQAVYADWLLANLPRAVAITGDGHIGWAAEKTLEDSRAQALATCRRFAGADCRLYAENLDVVWPGREQRAAPPPGPLLSSINYDFLPDPRYLWHGPGAAAGVYVWLHGFAGSDRDLAGLQPQGHVRAFNNAGFDVVRFDRRPGVDRPERAAGWLRDELAALRQSGYRRVVVGGQSRGAWTSLQMLDTAGLADVVVAVAPAAHGSGGSANLLAQDDDLRRLVAEAEPGPTRLAFVQFARDPFMGDADMRVRLIDGLRAKLAAVLVIDRPSGFSGHYGGEMPEFAPEFAECLLHFAQDAVPPAACPAP